MAYKVPGSLRGMPGIDHVLQYYQYYKEVEDYYISLLHCAANFETKYKSEFESFRKSYRAERPKDPMVEKTGLWKALCDRHTSSKYKEAVGEYWYLFSVSEEYQKVDQIYKRQPQGSIQVPSNFSETLILNPTSGQKGPLRGSYTVHVTGRRQQSVDSVLDQGHRNRQDLEEETLQLRLLVESQGEEIKALRKKEQENTATIEDLRRRLSGFASKQLTEGNPNFTDLSDKYRPTKIAERFHTAYDEEWTNALEVLALKKTGVKNEEEAIVLLMNIVKDIYNFCNNVIKEQTSNIVMNLLKPCTPKAIKGKENEVNKDVVKKLERQILVLRRENCMEPVLNITEKFKEHSKDYMAYQKCPEVVKYVEKCVELLWLMATSDPSMILIWPERGDKFNTNLFNHYANKGDKVLFAVWPAVLLHEGGPVMNKGYAKPM